MSNMSVAIQFKVVAQTAIQQVNRLMNSVRSVGKTSTAAGSHVKKMDKSVKSVATDMNKATKATQKAGKEAKTAGSKFSSMKGGIKSLAGIGIAGYGFTSILRGTAKSLQEVEVAQASLRGTAGIDKSSAAYKKLDATAEKLAATTQFSKTQLLGAMDAMASNGMSTKEILNGIKAVSTASAASMGKVDLVQSARNVTGALGAYRLEASKGMKVVDMFARATQLTSLKMEDLKYVSRETALAAVYGTK